MKRGARNPNGWTYSVSRWIEFDVNGVPFEGVGIGPDFWVSNTPADDPAARDVILTREMAEFNVALARSW